MSTFSSHKIGQQLYTRARSGIFRDTEGYDTIARSNGLDDQFVKKTLHPLCAYDAPAELTASGVKEEAAYPDAVHLVQLETGDVVLGRSLYKSADFTGLRSTFFTHNYVVPAEKAELLASEYMNFLYAAYENGAETVVDTAETDLASDGLPRMDAFGAERVSDSDAPDVSPRAERNAGAARGRTLPELESLPIRADLPQPKTGLEKLAELGIDGASFKRLLLAVMESVSGRRKVYVTLNAPIAETSERALRLLEVLYAALPPEFRRRLGFLTYSREPHSRKGVNLTFVEQGSMRPGDRNIEKDFLFDFSRGRIVNAAEGGSLQELADFLHDGLRDPQRLERFFAFADEALGSTPDALNVERYLELSRLLRIEEGDESPYENDRRGVLGLLFRWIERAGNTRLKARMFDLLGGRFDREMQDLTGGSVPEPELLRDIVAYFRVGGKGATAQVMRYLLILMPMVTRQKRKDGGMAYYAVIESDPELADMFFSTVIGNRQTAGMLFEPYLERKMQAAEDASKLIRIVQQWSDDHPGLLNNEHFCDTSRRMLGSKLRHAEDPVAAVRGVVETLRGDGGPMAHPVDGPVGEELMNHPLCVTLADEAIQYLLDEWEWDKVTLQQVTGLGFLFEGETEEERRKKVRGPRGTGKYAALRAAYLWFTQQRPDAGLLEELGMREMDEVQMLGKRLLPAEIAAGRYQRLLPAFSRSLSGGGEDVDYRRLVESVRTNTARSGGREALYTFFAWTATQEPYVHGRKFDPAYEAEIVRYFAAHDREAFKDKNNRRDYFEGAPGPLAAVYRKIQAQQASPLVRWMRRNRGLTLLLMGVLALLIVGGATVGVLYGTGVLGGEKETAQVSDPNGANSAAVPGTDEETEPADDAAAQPKFLLTVPADAKDGALAFNFRTAEERDAFLASASAIELTLEDGTTATLDRAELEAGDDPAPGSDAGTTGEAGNGTGTDANGAGSGATGSDAAGTDANGTGGTGSDATGTGGAAAGDGAGAAGGDQAGGTSGTGTDAADPGAAGSGSGDAGAGTNGDVGTDSGADGSAGTGSDAAGSDASGAADPAAPGDSSAAAGADGTDASAAAGAEGSTGSAAAQADPSDYRYAAVYRPAAELPSPVKSATVDGERYGIVDSPAVDE
ncbi:hypothetical protein CDO73_08530 [Saccharibacillus sp. O23]|uniref:GAP1-N2 domain-containing protein n=1 Tax=Saccharibacillus sp. O23 TaxID=2009338 RepID=UPI000B4E78C9|nr:hypothetical protein [Saccharibacillus sp. O23]OWR31172.1 hypothetical protein CDO73_08530 [Saccharibacillus sp. O23]